MSHTGLMCAAFQLVLLIPLSIPVFSGETAGWRTAGTGYFADANRPRTWSDEGETSVMQASGDYEEIARNGCKGYSSSPVFAGKRAFIRTQTHLDCVAEGSK